MSSSYRQKRERNRAKYQPNNEEEKNQLILKTANYVSTYLLPGIYSKKTEQNDGSINTISLW